MILDNSNAANETVNIVSNYESDELLEMLIGLN